MIIPSSTNPKVTEIGDYIFRVCFIDPFQGYVMAKFAHDNLKFTKVAILARHQVATTPWAWRTCSSASSPRWAGRSSARRPTPRATPTSGASSPRSSGCKPDGIYVPGYYTDVGRHRPAGPRAGHQGAADGRRRLGQREAVRAGRRGGGGQLLQQPLQPRRPERPRIQKFIADYKAAFGGVPDALAALGYDAAKVAVDAMKRADLAGPDGRPRRHRRDQELPRGDRHHHPRRAPQRQQARGRPRGRQGQDEVRGHHRPLMSDLRPAPHQRARRRHHLRPGGPRLHDGLRGAEAHQLRPRRRDDGGHVPRLRGGAEAGARAPVRALGRPAHLPGGDGGLRG